MERNGLQVNFMEPAAFAEQLLFGSIGSYFGLALGVLHGSKFICDAAHRSATGSRWRSGSR